jgi:hypothetical protein
MIPEVQALSSGNIGDEEIDRERDKGDEAETATDARAPDFDRVVRIAIGGAKMGAESIGGAGKSRGTDDFALMDPLKRAPSRFPSIGFDFLAATSHRDQPPGRSI